MRKADQITGIVLLIFSGFIIEESLRMYQPSDTGFEPGLSFFPFWLGVLMAALSLILLIKAWRSSEQTAKKIFPSRAVLLSIGLIVAGLTVYILLLGVLGFVLDTLLLAGFLLRGVMKEKWKGSLVLAAATSGALYLIFQILLGVVLPRGILGF